MAWLWLRPLPQTYIMSKEIKITPHNLGLVAIYGAGLGPPGLRGERILSPKEEVQTEHRETSIIIVF